MQVIQDTNAGGRFGEILGSGLNQLAQHKLGHLTQQYEREQTRKGLANYLGDDTANFLINLSPKEREHALSNLGSLLQLNQQPGQQQMGGMAALGNQQQPQQQEPQQQVMQQLQEAIKNRFTNQTVGQRPQEEQGSLLSGLVSEPQGVLRGAQQQPSMQAPEAQKQPQQKQQMTPERIKLIEDIFTSPHEKREREKLELQKRKVSSQENKEIREFSAPYRESARKAEASIRDYQQLLHDARSGELRSGNMYQLLKHLGWEEFGRNTTTEMAEKVIARLSQNVSGKFGTNARLTNFLEQTFQRSLPTLKNTPEGIQIIAASNMAMEEADIVRNNIRKDVLEQYGLTDQTEDIIEELAAPIIQKIDQDATEYAESLLSGKDSNKEFDDLPPAKYYKGETLDGDNGEILVSNGKEWIRKSSNKNR